MVQSIPTGNSPERSQEESSQAAEDRTAGGQIRTGNIILQTGSVDGSFVILTPSPENLPGIQARSTPSLQRPPRFPNLLDRIHEMEQVRIALGARQPHLVEFYGPSGTGKTALLSYLAYHPLVASFRDGIIYLPVEGQPVEDILQTLFNAFYECSIQVRLDESLLRQALQSKQALILLDDADQPGHELEELVEILPGCSIILATPERRLWVNGESLALQGLPVEAARALFEQAFNRELSPDEIPHFENLFTALQGFPQALLQAAALASNTSQSLADLAAVLRSAAIPVQALNGSILASLSEEESRVIYVLAAAEGASLAEIHLSHLTQISNVSPILKELVRRGILQTRGERTMLTGNLRAAALNTWDLTQWARYVTTYFAEWAAAQRQSPERLLEESGLLVHLMEWSAGIGYWKEVLNLARSLDTVLALAGRWGAWFQILQLGLQAAQALNRREDEAWALHQMGTRAMCLGRTQEARSSLIRSLRLRETCGDRAGAAAARHNLDILLPVQGKTIPVRAARFSWWKQSKLKPAAAVFLTLALLVTFTVFVSQAMHRSQEAGAVLTTQNATAAQAGVITQPGLLLSKGMSYLPALFSGREPLPTSTPTPWWKSTNPTPLIPFVPYTPATMVLVPVQPTLTRTTAPDQVLSAPVIQASTHSACGPPPGWIVYTVQRFDTLNTIASATGTAVQDLLYANCLNSLTWLTRGETLYVPRLPSTRTPTIPSTPAAITLTLTPAPVYPTSTATSTPPLPAPVSSSATSTVSPGKTPASSPAGSAGSSTAKPETCLEFEDLSLYQVYMINDTILTSGFPITVTNFIRANGIVLSNGDAEVDNIALSGGSGNELIVDSAALSFGFTKPVSGLSLLYGEYGGDLNLEINGEFRTLNRFSEVDQKTLGGVSIRVNSGPGSDRGTLALVGIIKQFNIGGLEVAVDQVCMR